MKLNVPLIAVGAVVGVAVLAACFRVSTAPERIRVRLEVARATCLQAGGSWVHEGGQHACRR